MRLVSFKSKPGFGLILTCLTYVVLVGCSSAPLLGKVESSPKTADASVEAYSKSALGLFDISTFDVYVDNDIIHVLAGGKAYANDKQTTLRYTRSEDGGRNWIEPIKIDKTFPATIASRGNDIQLAAKGEYLLAVWQAKGELPGMGPMVSAYSRDNGNTWAVGANPAANDAGDQSHLDLIADRQGYFHAVWLEDPEENGYQSLRYARSDDNGKQWSQARTLDGSTCSCCWNTLTVSPENGLFILYRDMKPRDMSLIQSKDAGNTWQKLSTVGEFGWQFDGCPHVGGSLAYSDGSGRLHSLAWTGLEQKAGLYYLSSENNGVNWSIPKKMGNTAIHGDVAADASTVVAVWDEMEPDGAGIFYSKAQDGANWGALIRLTKANNSATHPRVVAAKTGFLALWTEKPSKQASRLAWQILE